jgi:hypothetical protein
MMKILFTLIKFRNLYRVFKSFLSEISTAATVPTDFLVHSRISIITFKEQTQRFIFKSKKKQPNFIFVMNSFNLSY